MGDTTPPGRDCSNRIKKLILDNSFTFYGNGHSGKKSDVIYIDGPNRVGKTTLAGILAKNYTSKYSKGVVVVDESEGDPIKQIRDTFRRDGKPKNPKVMLYLKTAGRLVRSEKAIEDLQKEGYLWIYDRSYLTTLVDFLSSTHGNTTITDSVLAESIKRAIFLMNDSYFAPPEAHLVLIGNPEEIIRDRVWARTNERPAVPLAEDQELPRIKQENSWYRKVTRYAPNSYLIDTTNMQAEQVAETARSTLENLLRH